MAKGEQGGGVPQCVHHGRGVLTLRVVLLAREPDHGAIESHHGGADDGEPGNRGDADGRLDPPQSDDRPDEPHPAVQIDELALRESRQRQAALLHAVSRGARVMRLVPRQRQ